jgi:phage baseplate assembly protein W
MNGPFQAGYKAGSRVFRNDYGYRVCDIIQQSVMRCCEGVIDMRPNLHQAVQGDYTYQ